MAKSIAIGVQSSSAVGNIDAVVSTVPIGNGSNNNVAREIVINAMNSIESMDFIRVAGKDMRGRQVVLVTGCNLQVSS